MIHERSPRQLIGMRVGWLHALAASLLVSVAGCGGGGSGGGGAETLSDSEIRESLKYGTFTYDLDVYDGHPAVISRYWPDPATNRVTIGIYLPDAATSEETDIRQKFLNSVAVYNQRLAGYVSLVVGSSPLSFDTVNNQGYWRVSYGTSFVPPSSTDYEGYCANVSGGPNTGSFSYNAIPTASSSYTNSSINPMVWWINLGNGRCSLSQDIVTHEIGHALGLMGHFTGFGNGGAISDNMWTALLTLYKNPNGTPLEQATIYRR
jgi:hypothetical protein